ncbi:MAG: c-type cytochrome [Alphaproteobacteria bacterium]
MFSFLKCFCLNIHPEFISEATLKKALKRVQGACVLFVTVLSLSLVTPIHATDLGIGVSPTNEQLRAWDIDVRPDGWGYPEGSGSVEQGEEVFLEKCASCHGEFGEGVDRWPVLAGGEDTLDSEDPVKTIGSYWPYASTAYDYIYRAMPYGDAQSLEPDEVYSVIAYLFSMNDLVEDDFEANAQTLTDFVMPNVDGFIHDTREVVSGERCMTNCKDKVEIVSRARIIDVTPDR